MKKTVSVLLAVITLVMSVFTCNAFATEVENEIEVVTGFEATKTMAFLRMLEEADEISIKFSFSQKILGIIPMKIPFEFYTKEGKCAYHLGNGFIKANIIAQNGVATGYYPQFPFIYLKQSDSSFNINAGAFFVHFMIYSTNGYFYYQRDYSKTYEEFINGKRYTIDEFVLYDYNVYRFYYLDDDLTAFEKVNIYDSSVNQKYDIEISNFVDDSVFELPSTAVVDISWLALSGIY